MTHDFTLQPDVYDCLTTSHENPYLCNYVEMKWREQAAPAMT